MGFSLKAFLEELIRILNSEEEASKKVKLLEEAILEGKQYAEVCGEIPRNH
jgi:hypothetical protein